MKPLRDFWNAMKSKILSTTEAHEKKVLYCSIVVLVWESIYHILSYVISEKMLVKLLEKLWESL